jgi:hypothetical protein
MDVKFEGELVKLGEREFVVPSLSVNQARKLWPEILDLNRGVSLEDFPKKLDQALPIILAALSRNYPDLTLDELGDLVDVRNFPRLMKIIAGQSGLSPKPGEVRQPVVVQ